MKLASALTMGLVIATAALGNNGAAAWAQERLPTGIILPPDAASSPTLTGSAQMPPQIALPTASDLPATAGVEATPQSYPDAGSLPDLVARQTRPETLSEQLHCLAGAIYFEAKGQSLSGQLAVARVIVARAASGRFPGSYCGVVYQPSQFAFVHGRTMPAVAKLSAAWRDAVAIAQIADSGSWRSVAEGALYFHAAGVTPGWRLTRVARVDDHVFYR